MNVKTYSSQRLNETYYEIIHPSGLKIFVLPKEGYRTSYGILGTPFGSINTKFITQKGEVVVPDGIAHYLEHKLFESEEGDAFTRYAETGANANAYTSFDKTCYLFSGTDQFEKNLSILLEMVTNPYFTEETVKKEQGIIGQEIKMYEDSPEWRVLFNLLGALYHNHPVKVDIAGTIESISKITPDSLYECYNSYYNLHNMALSVVGNVTVEQVISVCDKCLLFKEKSEVTSVYPKEPYEVSKHFTEQKFPVSLPLFNLGFKLRADSLLCEKQLALFDIVMFMLASSTSPLYRKLMDDGLINSTFSYELFEGNGYCSIIFSGESRAPEKASEIIKDYINDVKSNGFTGDDFTDAKKATYGDAVSSFNSVDTIANMLEDFCFCDRKIFDYYDQIANAEEKGVYDILNMIDVENSALSIVRGE